MFAVAIAATVKIGVFSLFHPAEIEIKPAPGQVLIVEANSQRHTLERGQVLRLRSSATASGRDGAMAQFILSVPGPAGTKKIEREFTGRLQVLRRGKELIPVVEMPRELAVSSIVAAEMSTVPMEALKVQAIVARSFLAGAHYRHEGYDSCDTTHCQFMRHRPEPGSNAALATEHTRGMTITYRGRLVPALYSGNCGGHTRDLAEAGWNVENYPFFGVTCPVKGQVAGHRIGLCQMGAVTMAKRGAKYRDILAHFFPATALLDLDKGAEPTLAAELQPSLRNLLNPFVLFNLPVADMNDAMGVHGDVVLVRH